MRRPMPWIALLLALLTSLSACDLGAAPPAAPDCSTPRRAADSLFVWQSAGHVDLAKAAACVEGPADQRTRRAAQLKAVLDARGIWAPVSSLSDDPSGGEDGEDGRITLVPDPRIELVRGDDRQWRYAADTMAQVPRWHAETFSPLALWMQRAVPALGMTLGPIALWQLVFGALLLLVAWGLSTLVQQVAGAKVVALARRFRVLVDEQAMARANGPIAWTILFAVIAWGLPQLQLPITLSSVAVTVAALGLRLSLVVVTFRLIDALAGLGLRLSARTENKLDDQLIPLLRSTAKTLALTIGAFALLQAVGVDVWKLVAGASVGGIIVGLAAQDSMKNFFGSLNVFVDQPFQVGDWIQVAGVEGTVEEVGFRSTRVRTFHNSQVTVPNSVITNANVDNMGRRHRRRVKMLIGLTYDTPPDVLQAYAEGVRAILAAHPNVQNTYEVHVYDLGASSIQILVYYHLVVPDWHTELTTRSQNLLEFIRLAHALGVSFAFPSQSLYLESTPERPLPPHPDRSLEELGTIFAGFSASGEQSRPDGPRFPRTWDAPDVAREDETPQRGNAEDA